MPPNKERLAEIKKKRKIQVCSYCGSLY